MEYTKLQKNDLLISKITLGTWAIGGAMWGGTDDENSEKTIIEAIRQGITTIDTAPVYGFGKSEEIVGNAIKKGAEREDVVIATKAGLQWHEGKVFRNTSRKRLEQELQDSLKRLQTDYIDLYQIHWPDFETSFEETGTTLKSFLDKGLIKAVGVSNFSPDQIKQLEDFVPVHTCQPPYNLYERDIEADVKLYCDNNKIDLLTYGAICRGMLSGKMSKNRYFKGDDLRKDMDPKFKEPRFSQYLAATNRLETYAQENYNVNVLQLSVRWLLDKGVTSPIWGARNPGQLNGIERIFGWSLSNEDFDNIDQIIAEEIKDPTGPEFMAPPKKRPAL